MDILSPGARQSAHTLDPQKFQHPHITAKGEKRAYVGLNNLDTLWINTGSLCNIACTNCYIESSPTNDAYIYFTLSECERYLDELETLNYKTTEIAFTGGEPFMNKDMIGMMRVSLERGYDVLILTNAMQPLMRPKVQEGLLELLENYQDKMTFRVSLDHHTEILHDDERGPGAFSKALEGMTWLSTHGFMLNVAGRSCWNESEEDARKGYAALFEANQFDIDAHHPGQTVIFPEMDDTADVPEITTECWSILNKSPDSMMCASSRMLVHRKGEEKAEVLPCTLLVYDDEFVMGDSLATASTCSSGNMSNGAVKLNHPHCAKFCVLGGASCSA